MQQVLGIQGPGDAAVFEAPRCRRATKGEHALLKLQLHTSRLSRKALLGLVIAGTAIPASIAFSAESRVLVDGKSIPVSGAHETVAKVLRAAGVELRDSDEVTPPLDTTVTDGAVIRVSRVQQTSVTVDRPLPYRVVVQAALGRRSPRHPTVTRPGRAGITRVTTETRIVDGQTVATTVREQQVVRPAVDLIVTSRAPWKLGSRGVYTGKKSFTVSASAYDPGVGSCGKNASGRTCTGQRAGYGIVAVDPTVIPLGSKLFVPGYGYGIAADVGGAVKGNRVDLGFNSRSAALQWGRRRVVLRVVD